MALPVHSSLCLTSASISTVFCMLSASACLNAQELTPARKPSASRTSSLESQESSTLILRAVAQPQDLPSIAEQQDSFQLQVPDVNFSWSSAMSASISLRLAFHEIGREQVINHVTLPTRMPAGLHFLLRNLRHLQLVVDLRVDLLDVPRDKHRWPGCSVRAPACKTAICILSSSPTPIVVQLHCYCWLYAAEALPMTS